MPDPIDDRIVGKRGFITYFGLDTQGGEDIPLTLWNARVSRSHVDTTGSRSYNPEHGVFHPTRLPTAVDIEARIEGCFRLNNTPRTLIWDIFRCSTSLGGAGDTVSMDLWFDEQNQFCSGQFSLSHFAVDSPVEGVVTFTAMAKCWGVPDLGSYGGPIEPPTPLEPPSPP